LKVTSLIRAIPFALIVIGLTACAGSKQQDSSPDDVMKEIRYEVNAIVAEPARAKQVLVLAEELNQIFISDAQQSKIDKLKHHELNTNFNTTEASFKAFLNELNIRARNQQIRVLRIRDEIKNLLAPEEWKKLNSVRDDFVNENAQWL